MDVHRRNHLGMIREICVQSTASALLAEQYGGDRLELCTALEVGGITPSYGLMRSVANQVKLPIHVLIRPRIGNFCYTKEEESVMRRDIIRFLKQGAQGIVIGALTPGFELDLEVIGQLIVTAKNQNSDVHITVHRAFDWVHNPMKALDQLQELGVDTLLSSGQAISAEKGIELLRKMNQKCGEALTVMPGAGITGSNQILFKHSGFRAIHASASSLIQDKLPSKSVIFEKTQHSGQRLEIDLQKLKDLLQK